LRSLVAAILFCLTFAGPVMAEPGSQQVLPNSSEANAPIRIGLTPVFLDNQTTFVNAWRVYLTKRLHRPIEFVQRASYREITDLLRAAKLEFAWICGAPFVRNKNELKLLAVPVYQGKTTYRSYLIVPANDHLTASLSDLRGKIFAFSDRDSNSGYLVPVHELRNLHQNPGSFFARTFFTWSHRNVVQAVADGLAQAGAVDSYVWDMLAIQSPKLTGQTRIVQASKEHGFPPFVATRNVSPEDVEAMRRTLIDMSKDTEGVRLLKKLRLDGFVAGNEHLYDSIAAMIHETAEN
jgi:phosphonate transport system substrate-binding protein